MIPHTRLCKNSIPIRHITVTIPYSMDRVDYGVDILNCFC